MKQAIHRKRSILLHRKYSKILILLEKIYIEIDQSEITTDLQMKFRKSSLSSPKMELLSRRPSNDRISTLKRSRSFRASVKLMSKIRNHANLRLTTGFDLSSISKDLKKERNLYVIEESRDSVRSLNLRKEDASSRIDDKSDENEIFSNPRKISVSSNDIGSQEITKDLKSKLSLTDKIMGKGRKDTEKPSTKNESIKSPKGIRIFRKKRSVETFQDDAREKNCSVSYETDIHQPNKNVFYENPTFVLDTSLDSSISSFLYKEEEKEEEQRQDYKNEHPVSCERDILTVVVDSHKATINKPFDYKINYEQDRYDDEKCLEKSQNAFRSRCETDPLRCFCEERNKNSQANATNGNRRTAESFGGFDRSRIKFYSKIHETRKNASNYLQDQKFFDNVKTCSSKSCKIRTVDNFTNFWMSRRGNSFRSKMAADKRDVRETKDYERIDQERALVSTSSGSSTLDQ